MVICGNHMHKFSVSKDMKIKPTMIKGEGERLVGKVVTHLCLTRLKFATSQYFGAQCYQDEPVSLRPNLVEVCDFTVNRC